MEARQSVGHFRRKVKIRHLILNGANVGEHWINSIKGSGDKMSRQNSLKTKNIRHADPGAEKERGQSEKGPGANRRSGKGRKGG